MFETLITQYQSPPYFSAQMARDSGMPESGFRALWSATEQGRGTGELTLEAALERVLRAGGRFTPERLMALAAGRAAAKEECFRHLHPGILPMLDALRARGVRIGLVSNCFWEEAGAIRRSTLLPYFDAVCLSCELGVLKPDRAIFDRCLSGLGLAAADCVYVGDGGSMELEAARALGMRAVQAAWYLREGTAQPVGLKPEFPQADAPADVLGYL